MYLIDCPSFHRLLTRCARFGSGNRALLSVLLAVVVAPNAQALLINNGLAPPNPRNVLDVDFPVLPTDTDGIVEIRDAGCTGTGPCAGAGVPTTVQMFESFNDQPDVGFPNFVTVRDNSVFLMSGGFVGDDVIGYDDATIVFDGGTLNELRLTGQSSGSILGGIMRAGVDTAFSVVDSASAELRGSSIKAGAVVRILGTATLDIFGLDFFAFGQPQGAGEIPCTSPEIGSPCEADAFALTGVLESGEVVDIEIQRDPTTTIILHIIPEPSTALLLGIGLLGLSRFGRTVRE